MPHQRCELGSLKCLTRTPSARTEFPCTRTITLRMQDTNTRSVGGTGIRRRKTIWTWRETSTSTYLGLSTYLGTILSTYWISGWAGAGGGAAVMPSSCQFLDMKVFAKTCRYTSLAHHLFLFATCAAKRFPYEVNALIRISVCHFPPIARRHAVITGCKIAYMDYLQRWSFFFSILISGDSLLSFGGGAARWTLGLARLLSS